LNSDLKARGLHSDTWHKEISSSPPSHRQKHFVATHDEPEDFPRVHRIGSANRHALEFFDRVGDKRRMGASIAAFEERQLPSYLSACLPKLKSARVRAFTLGPTKKLVVYDRMHPEIRLVLLLDAGYERDGEIWQPITKSSVERDRSVDPKRSEALERKLWDEVCRVETRGRPRGTGHPIRQFSDVPISSAAIDRLRKAGLDDKDLRILFERPHKTFDQIGRELKMSGQAAWKRWTQRIEPALKKLNREFSRDTFKFLVDHNYK